MEFVFELLFQIVGEIVLQAIFEVLFELGIRSLADPLRGARSAVLSVIGFVLWGFIAGGLSLLILPTSLITDPRLRVANLVITPIVVGVLMALIGKARLKRGQNLVLIDRFGFAFIFAISMALVRFIWAG